jgi:hypothetical protein
MRFSIFAWVAAGVLKMGPADAQGPDDPAAARERLKEGFMLRKAGSCADALPLFLESFRLAPQPKALLNLADCEERLGHFIDAEGHWAQARDVAGAQGNAALQQEAADRLAELGPRMPRLTIALAAGAPPSSRVLRDGVEFAPGSLGVPLPCDGGRHTIEVRAEGYEPKVFEVALTERDATRIDVEPGPRWQPADAAPGSPQAAALPDALEKVLPPALARPQEVRSTAHDPGRAGHEAPFYVGLGIGTLGMASIGLGVVEGVSAVNDHQSALDACHGSCGSSAVAQSDQTSAQHAATWANVGFVAGGALLATSVALIFIPSATASSARPAAVSHPGRPSWPVVAPLVGATWRGIALGASW